MVLKILQWNLNGYHNNYNELRLLQHNHSPHIIALQETHLKDNPTINQIPKNYNFYAKHSNSQSAKHGVAFLISKTISFHPLNSNNNLHSIAINISAKIPFTLINTYIPPTQQISSNDLYSLISSTNNPILVVGDFNAWSPLWGSSTYNKRGKILSEFITNNNFVVLNNNKPTHFSTHRTFTNIDVAFCSSELLTFSSWDTFDSLHGSDHYPIKINLFATPSNNFLKRTIFKTDKADWVKFQSLGSKYIKIQETSQNVNCMAARFHKGIIQCANESMPISRGNFSKKPICWWNDQINILQSDKKEKWKIFKKEQTLTNFIQYKKANAIFKRETKISKRKSFIEFTRDINPNTPIKVLWDKVRSLKGNPAPSTIKCLKLSDNSIIDQPLEIANALGENWSNYSNDNNFSDYFRENKVEVLNNLNVTYNLSSRAKQIENKITLIELESCLQSLSGKTPGYDKINYPMLKNLAKSEKRKLCHLYNTIFETSIIPFQWKKAIVIPIKKQNKSIDSLSGYRPISLLSCLSKTLEKIVARRLAWYLIEENKLSINQTAYKSNSSTIDALLTLDEYISNSLSSSNHISVISVDAEKAFDRVGIHTIIQQLQKWKCGPLILNFVRNFLSNRRFSVRLNNIHSNTFKLHNGIPQGSPISVILFLIAFNSLSIIIDDSKYFKHVIYADDLYIYRIVQDTDLFKSKLNLLYNSVINWCMYSGVKISEDKCKHLHICKKHNCNNIVIELNASRLENVTNMKILGVIFNNRYLWNSHVNYLINSIQNRLNVLKCLSNLNLEPNTNSLLNITKSTILSKIDYGLPVYGNTSKNNIAKISSPYYAAIRLSLGAFCSTPIKNMLAESGMPTIPQRKEFLTNRLIPKILNPKKTILSKLTANKIKRKKTPKKMSTISLALQYANKLKISKNFPNIPKLKSPPWSLNPNSIDLHLTKWRKPETPSHVFKKEYLHRLQRYKNWKHIFTDGSKSEHGTGYGIVSQTGQSFQVIQSVLLPPESSVFTAELEAILEACKHAVSLSGNKIICTDSYSTLSAVLNINCKNFTVCHIRDILINNASIKLMWVPSHVGISGNEEADIVAKASISTPQIAQNIFSPNDIKNVLFNKFKHNEQLEWNLYTHFYKTLNPLRQKQVFPSNIPRREVVAFTRLRMGHTRLTHKKYFDSTGPTDCVFCQNEELSIQHIIDDCPAAYEISQRTGIHNLRNTLSEMSHKNIKNIAKFLRHSKLFFEI